MSKMTPQYQAAMAASFQNAAEFRIPSHDLAEIFQTPLGFQPCGISRHGETVMVADYFMPGIMLLNVSKDEQGLLIKVGSIRGVMAGNESVRLWPDIAQPGGANRCQTMGLASDGSIWVNRNAQRRFAVLTPPSAEGGKWNFWHNIQKRGPNFW